MAARLEGRAEERERDAARSELAGDPAGAARAHADAAAARRAARLLRAGPGGVAGVLGEERPAA
jgi:hypothetical protein